MIRELTTGERAAIRELVVKQCANYCGHYKLCLPLDTDCYMLNKWWTGSLCRYFERAVLPVKPALEAALLDHAVQELRTCAICGKPLFAAANRAKYCGSCAGSVRRKRQREYMRKNRSAS